MEFKLEKSDPAEIKTQLLILPVFKDEKYEELETLDKKLEGKISKTLEKDFDAKLNSTFLLDSEDYIRAEKILLVGLGKKEELELDFFRQAGASSIQKSLDLKKSNPSVFLDFGDLSKEESSRAFLEGAILGSYKFEKFKTEEEGNKKLESLKLIYSSKTSENLKEKLKLSKIYTQAANYTKDLVNTPANKATPSFIANEAEKLAKENSFNCKILDKEKLKEFGMQGILAVSSGSSKEPKTIILEYEGEESGKEKIALIGKGITFDSGGISLKPSKELWKMKFDKAGACNVLGIFKAVSEAKLPINLVGIIPCCENLPSGSATKPGDIIKPYKGKSVEVINTDAEGRLILADSLSYAKELKPKVVIDFATLTGACIKALGHVAAGMFSESKDLENRIEKASESSGERVWELPLFKEYEKQLESQIADIKNIGKDGAGASIGAKFLENFVEDYEWLHLDIAGTAFDRENDGIAYYGKNATGFGVRLILYFLENWE